MKSEGALQRRMRELTRHVLLALMVVIAVVSVWTPLGWQYVADRWFTLPNFFWFLPVPLLVGLFSVLIWRLTRNPASHSRPFLLTLGLIFLGFSGWVSACGQHYSAAHHPVGSRGAPASQLFMLVGTLLIIPVILVYTARATTSSGARFRILKAITEERYDGLAYTGHYLPD